MEINTHPIFGSIQAIKPNAGNATGAASSAAQSFSDMLNKAIADVDKDIKVADQKMVDLASGKDKDIHGAMIAVEKADLSLKLLLAIRNKALNAYQEISRMQV